jgi:hypothetical protein
MRPHLLPLAALIASPALAQDPSWPPEFNTIITDSAGFCEGEFSLADGTVSQIDLNGDGRLDWLMDAGGFRCSTDASLYCGTLGCGVETLIDGTRGLLTLHSWEVRSEAGITYLAAPNEAGETRRFLWSQNDWILQ